MINAGVGALRRFGQRYLRVSYEELVADPAPTVRRVLDFAGADGARSPVGADRTVVLTPSHTAAGNPDRFRSGRTRIAGDAEWQDKMRLRDRLAVTALCALSLARARGRTHPAGGRTEPA